MKHLLSLPMAYFERRHVGDIVTRFGSIAAIQQALTTSSVEAIVDGLLAATTFGMMLAYSPRLAALSLGCVALYALLRLVRYGALRAAADGQIVRAARQQSNLLETLRGMQTIKLFSHEAERHARFMKLAVENTNANIRLQRLGLDYQSIALALVTVEAALVLWLAGRHVLDGVFTIGMLLAFVSYKDQFTGRLTRLVDKLIDFRMLRLHVERLSDIVLTPPEIDDRKLPPLSFDGACDDIELRNVSFRYADTEPWVIRNVSFHVRAGESVALVGPSGCGKTTLMKIMLGQMPPTEGEVLVGGVSLATLGVGRYRNRIASVMQDDRLFAGTLAENISFFDLQRDDTWVQACAVTAGIDADIRRMPMRYESFVGDMGTALSGGQKQRILLARALYKRPSILFLDEATSHLDPALERQVASAVSQLPLTRVVVAHRPETIALAGRQIVLNG
jgi:ATP-binding cassette subfamily B protein RaxB